MSRYRGVSGIARNVTKRYRGVDGVARSIAKSYRGVDGVARQFFSSGTPVSELAVGASVYIDVGGVSKEFIVVHQGNPDPSLYDASCDGTWLLMKDVYGSMVWDSSDNDYEHADVHGYLKTTFYGLLSEDVRFAIKRAVIPYRQGTGTNGSVVTGADGLSVKIFLLSGSEVGMSSTIGAKLDYFDASNNSKRIAYNNGSAVRWWLREAANGYSNRSAAVSNTGGLATVSVTGTNTYIRPAFILYSNATFDPETYAIG